MKGRRIIQVWGVNFLEDAIAAVLAQVQPDEIVMSLDHANGQSGFSVVLLVAKGPSSVT